MRQEAFSLTTLVQVKDTEDHLEEQTKLASSWQAEFGA